MYYVIVSFEVLWDAVVLWLMVLVAEEHNCCLKEVWDWLERIVVSEEVASVITDMGRFKYKQESELKNLSKNFYTSQGT